MQRIVIMLFFFWGVCSGQSNNTIDSLKQASANPYIADSLRCDGYVSVIRYYRNTHADSCRAYFEKLFQFAQERQSITAFYQYHRLKADYFGLFEESKGDAYTFITGNLLQGLEYAKQMGDPKLQFKMYARLTQENARLGKEEAALQYAKEAESISLEHGLWEDTAYIYGQIGKIYNLGFGKTDKALQYLLKSDSIYRVNQFQGYQWGFTLSFIGDVYDSFDDFEEAKSYQEQALAIFQKSENEYQQNFIYGKLGILESKLGNYTKAINLVTKAISYYETHKYPVQESAFLVVLSEIYLKAGQKEGALQAGQKAIDISSGNKDDYGLMKALVNESKIFQASQDYAKSNALALKAEDLAKAMSFYEELKSIYEILYKNAESLGNYQHAFQYSNDFRRVNDTLVARENLQKAKELEAKYQNEQKENEIALLTTQNELISKQKENQKILLLGGIGLTAFVGFFFFILYRNRQKTNEKLRELDVAKSNFFTNISHEFRTPLTLISAPIEKKLEEGHLSEVDRHDFELVQRNSNRLLTLVDQLLDLSKLESGNLKLKVCKGDLSTHLKSIAASFQYKANQHHLTYDSTIMDSLIGWYDADALEKITVNLLSNAFKYVSSQGIVRFQAMMKQEKLLLQVENSGEISGHTSLDQVFNRFFQKDENREGVGIGLALAKELVSLHHGSIEVRNTSQKTVLFEVQLPIAKEAFAKDEFDVTPEVVSERTRTINTESSLQSGKAELSLHEDAPILLIVDDHEDIRAFVKSAFRTSYHVVEAADGQEGIEKARALIPDIVVSDLMMPHVSGMELCKVLKNDERTSHVPILLLTAKAEEGSQYEGLETGADDYIVKPFKLKFLETRIHNLVASRKQLRERFSQEIVLKPKSIAISRIDQKFIEKLQKVLDQYLTQPDFSVEDFSKQLGMSRMQLHRKLKALTGITASEFIRNERLKLAASLLKESDAQVSEICYQVGFNNPSYFAKCFKETYGCLPSEYSQE